jgi:hypothetical protein
VLSPADGSHVVAGSAGVEIPRLETKGEETPDTDCAPPVRLLVCPLPAWAFTCVSWARRQSTRMPWCARYGHVLRGRRAKPSGMRIYHRGAVSYGPDVGKIRELEIFVHDDAAAFLEKGERLNLIGGSAWCPQSR